MRFRLRTLLIVLAIGPIVLAGAWFAWWSRPTKEQQDWIRAIERESRTTAKQRLGIRSYQKTSALP